MGTTTKVTGTTETRLEDVVIRTSDDGLKIRNIAETMNLDKGYLVDILLADGRFNTATWLMRHSRSEWKRKAQAFLDLFFKGEIDPNSDEILKALVHVPYKKNILKLFEIKKYGYNSLDTIKTIFSRTKSFEAKKKMVLIMLINFNKAGDIDKFVFNEMLEEIKGILTLDDVDLIMFERMVRKREIWDRGSQFLSEKLGYENREGRLYEYLVKRNAIEERSDWIGLLILHYKSLKEKVKEIPIEYWVETPISLSTLKEEADIVLTKDQLESRLQYLLKLPDEFDFALETAEALGRKITTQELDIHIRNNPGRISTVHDKEWVEYTDDQFIEIMKSWSRFHKPWSLRWFWDYYSLEHNKTLQRIYRERPNDIKDAWETILAALFKSDFKEETAVINQLLKDLGRSMTEKERRLYSKKVFGV